MVFQQIPPLLLLVSYYLFLLLVCVTRICGNEGGGMLPVYAEKRRKRVTRICVENSAKSHKPAETSDLPPMTIHWRPHRLDNGDWDGVFSKKAGVVIGRTPASGMVEEIATTIFRPQHGVFFTTTGARSTSAIPPRCPLSSPAQPSSCRRAPARVLDQQRPSHRHRLRAAKRHLDLGLLPARSS